MFLSAPWFLSEFMWCITYTPIPWATILCIILYRHDLSQLVRPFKDRGSIKDWKSVFQDLNIPLKVSSSSGKPGGKPRGFFSIREDISKRYPNIRFYALVVANVTGSSLLSSLIVLPVLIEDAPLISSRLSVIVSGGLQFASAFPSIFAMQRYFGPFPSAPNKFHLKKRRQGSLLRYEETLGHTSLREQ